MLPKTPFTSKIKDFITEKKMGQDMSGFLQSINTEVHACASVVAAFLFTVCDARPRLSALVKMYDYRNLSSVCFVSSSVLHSLWDC